MKRSLVSLMLSLVLCVHLFAAGSAEAYTDHSAGFPERVTIKIPVYDRAFDGWNVTDNYYTQWAQREFGDKYNVDVSYVAIGRSTEVADYQQMLASHTAPHIIMHYDMPQALAYYSEDVMQELDWEEIAFYAPTFWKNSGVTTEDYGTVEGKKMFVFAERPLADNWTHIIRLDWVEAAGYAIEDLTSLEVYNEMLLKWKELGLGVQGHRLQQNNFTYSYLYRDWPIDEVQHTLYSELGVADFTTEATKGYLKNLNYQYNQGILDQEFYLRDDETKEKAEFVAGRIGLVSTYLTGNTDIITSTLANNPDAKFAILPDRARTPADKYPQSRGYWPFGMIMGVNYEASDMERIALWMYLDWLSQPENLMKWQNGIEGENYTLDDTGLAVKNPDYSGEAVLSANSNKDYWCLVVEGMRYESAELFEKANLQAWSPPGYEYLAEDIIKCYKEYLEYRVPDAMFTVVLEKLPEYKADLNELWKELYVKCAIASEGEFEAAYEAACRTYLDAGYQAILDEKQAAVEAGNYIP